MAETVEAGTHPEHKIDRSNPFSTHYLHHPSSSGKFPPPPPMPCPEQDPAESSPANAGYAIARIDLPGAGTHGWQVRLQRRGIKYGKFFADRSHGHPERALHTARQWRDDLLNRLIDRARVCECSPRNSSGVVGVSKISVISSNGNSYHFWQATWSPTPGQRRCVKFSIKRYGDREAFELAVEARTEGIQP